MSYSPTVDAAATTARRPRLLPTAIATVTAAIAFTVLAIYGDPHERGQGPGQFLTICAIILVASAVVFGFAVPRAVARGSHGSTGLVMSALAALLVFPAFWSGLPAVLAVGGTLLGWTGRGSGRGAGRAQIAFVLGLLAVVAWVAINVLDWMNQNGMI